MPLLTRRSGYIPESEEWYERVVFGDWWHECRTHAADQRRNAYVFARRMMVRALRESMQRHGSLQAVRVAARACPAHG